MIRILSLISGLVFSLSVSAEITQNYGEVFPVIEQDIRLVIQGRLNAMEKSNAMNEFKEKAIERVKQSTYRPNPLLLTPADETSSYYVDPSITLKQDIRLPNGQLIAASGTRINPMEKVTLSYALIFFNGDDEEQVAWVKSHYKKYPAVKFILTGGDIRDAANLFGRIYFDQEARLTEKLHIQHVPSIAVQEGVQWKITTIGRKELHHA